MEAKSTRGTKKGRGILYLGGGRGAIAGGGGGGGAGGQGFLGSTSDGLHAVNGKCSNH